MTYAKPELVALTHAVAAIQDQQPPKDGTNAEGASCVFTLGPAYQADE